MSLSFRDHYIAVIGANGIGLSRCNALGQSWLGSAGFIADRSAATTVAMETLQRLLAEHAPKQGRSRARLSVLVASHYSRFGLVPWSEHISTPDELRAYAMACFEETYGKSDEAWNLSLSPESSGQPRVAVGLPQALLDQLRSVVKDAGLKLVSVQPYLMSAFNRFQKALGPRNFLFVVAEPGRSTLLLAREGRWSAVRSLRIADSDAALGSLIARESELHGLNGDQPVDLFVHAPARHHDAPRILGVQVLELLAGDGDALDALQIMSRTVN